MVEFTVKKYIYSEKRCLKKFEISTGRVKNIVDAFSSYVRKKKIDKGRDSSFLRSFTALFLSSVSNFFLPGFLSLFLPSYLQFLVLEMIFSFAHCRSM